MIYAISIRIRDYRHHPASQKKELSPPFAPDGSFKAFALDFLIFLSLYRYCCLNTSVWSAQIILDIQQFSPEEITVKTVGNNVIVEAKHEERQDEHGFVSRHFVRRYVLPSSHDVINITSSLSSDGVLTITAPKKVTRREGARRRIRALDFARCLSIRKARVLAKWSFFFAPFYWTLHFFVSVYFRFQRSGCPCGSIRLEKMLPTIYTRSRNYESALNYKKNVSLY